MKFQKRQNLFMVIKISAVIDQVLGKGCFTGKEHEGTSGINIPFLDRGIDHMDVIHSPKFKLYLINNKEEIVSISSFIHPFIYLFIYQTVLKKGPYLGLKCQRPYSIYYTLIKLNQCLMYMESEIDLSNLIWKL